MKNENYFLTKDNDKIFYHLVQFIGTDFVLTISDDTEFLLEEEKELFLKSYDEWLNLPKEPTIFVLRGCQSPLVYGTDKNIFRKTGDHAIEAEYGGERKYFKNQDEADNELDKIQEFILSGRKKLVLDWRE